VTVVGVTETLTAVTVMVAVADQVARDTGDGDGVGPGVVGAV
jgi:hypothetical protein